MPLISPSLPATSLLEGASSPLQPIEIATFFPFGPAFFAQREGGGAKIFVPARPQSPSANFAEILKYVRQDLAERPRPKWTLRNFPLDFPKERCIMGRMGAYGPS